MKKISILLLAVLATAISSRIIAQESTTIQTCEYWFDYDFDSRQRINMSTDGLLAQQFNLAQLPRGLHSIGLRFCDSRGRWGAPYIKHFVVPLLPEPVITGMTAYEYWFNHGPRVRVEVEPQQTLTLSDVAIGVNDVIPNAITCDYRFNVTDETVYCPDQVFFGIQAFDNVGHPSSGILSESFALDVPVNPHFITLESGTPVDFVTPATSSIRGFKVSVQAGDSVMFTLNDCGEFDLYDAEGLAMECSKTSDVATALATYTALSRSQTVYVLLWNVPQVISTMHITYNSHSPSGIYNVQNTNLGIQVENSILCLENSAKGDIVSVYDVLGTTVYNGMSKEGTLKILLPTKGIYIIKVGNYTKKIVNR